MLHRRCILPQRRVAVEPAPWYASGAMETAILTAEQMDLREQARRVARDVVAEVGETGGRVDRRLVKALGDSGILRWMFGDAAGSAMPIVLAREALAEVSTAAETAFAMQGLGGRPIHHHGRPQVKERWVAAVAAGDAVAAFALTEAEHGSDAGEIELAAERDGDGWRLSGTKTWISNAPHADVYTLFARTTPGAGTRGITAFVLPGDSDGLSGRPL